MRVLFVTAGGESHPSARVRALQFVPAFRRTLGPTAVVNLGGGSQLSIRLRQAWAVVRAWRADVVVLQFLSSPTLARGLARVNRRLIWDIDDGVYLGNAAMLAAVPVFERVVVGNRFLAADLVGLNPAVTVIPSVVDEARFPLADPARRPRGDGPFTVGWIGHAGNLRNLPPLRPAFESLAERFGPRVVLKVVSNEPFDFGPGGPAVVNKAWRLDQELADVRSFDAGIMPLDDTDWNRHKCAYKALLYMSQGVPTVVSPVGVNADVIADGVNGFHATAAADWVDRIGRLVDDADLAERMGAAGRRTIAEGFTVAAVMPAWAAVLRGGSGPEGAPRPVGEGLAQGDAAADPATPMAA